MVVHQISSRNETIVEGGGGFKPQTTICIKKVFRNVR
jgi:hypothetical protein